jgi:hypothetical protein
LILKNKGSNIFNLKECSKNGAQRWDRTTDTRIFSPLLYQLSYLGLKLNIGL